MLYRNFFKLYVVMPLTFSVVILLASCSGNSAEKQAKADADSARARAVRSAHPDPRIYADQVAEAEQKMKASTTLDVNLANRAIKAYLDFASTFPDDSRAPDYYFRAGGIAVAAGNYDQGIACYDHIVQKYPDYKYVVEALYQEAMIYDSNLPGQDEKARVLYEQLIHDYPKNKLADDAKAAISHLGKTDEEIVKEFEAKNKK